MGLKDRLRRLEREAEGEMVFVPQEDGTVKRFPQSEDVPHHPLGVAAAECPDPEWSRSLYSAAWTNIIVPVEDLSE